MRYPFLNPECWVKLSHSQWKFLQEGVELTVNYDFRGFFFHIPGARFWILDLVYKCIILHINVNIVTNVCYKFRPPIKFI